MTTGRIRRALGWITAAAVIVLGATACGSSTGGDVSKVSFVTGPSSAAAIAPAGAIAYFAVDTSLSSRQWQQAGALLSRFPDKTKLLSRLLQSWQSGTGTSFESDVRPALGGQLDGVVFARAGAKSPDVVLLLQPKTTDAFKRFLAKIGTTPVGDYRGWKVIGRSQSSIAAFEAAAKTGPPLSNDPTFKQAIGSLSGDALATVYANGSKLTTAVTGVFPQAASATGQKTKLAWAAADLAATADGLRLDGAAKTVGSTSSPRPMTAALLDRIPADVLGVMSFNGATFRANAAQIRNATHQGLKSSGSTIPGAQRLVATFERLGAAFANEDALYVRNQNGPIPEFTLVTTPGSPASVDAAATKTSQAFTAAHAVPQAITIGTVAAHTIDLGRVSVYWGADHGRFIVTTNQQAFGALDDGGPKLADDSTFKEAKSAAAMPDATDGFLYINLTSSIQTIENYAHTAGTQIPPEVANNLKPLHTVLAWATNEGSIAKFGLFVGIN